ncbi:sterol-sensing domain of SREBP cleavage-activation domain-containing protein [Trichoderma velutinum]
MELAEAANCNCKPKIGVGSWRGRWEAFVFGYAPAMRKAPVLSASHPLRRVLTRYGRHASRYAITTLLISAAVASFLIYPLPFIYTSHVINGASTLPRHVWTAAQPLPYDNAASPDIVMRSIWVHSSYMQALSPDILLSALDLQDELLGDTRDFGPSRSFGLLPPSDFESTLTPVQRDALHIVNGLTNQSWIFQSPLLYWNCSRDRILADNDILATVNDRKNHTTPANITLRHSIVFSGKRFEDRRLLAADALVITLLYRTDSPVGRQWEAVAPSLPDKMGDKWDIYPPSGNVSASQLYEFQFRPMSVQDSIILALAYTLSLVYFLQQVSKARAVKSKLGLIVTVMIQIIMSIAASFTICGIFKIDLSRIPRAAYPLVILSMSLEHILRLMDAVVRTPSGENTSSRIGSAFGETAPTALVSTVQNFVILLGLSYAVTPSVSAFCIFAAIAIVLDFFFLSSFFISVLSVDVRRMELEDALAKEAMRRKRKARRVRENPSWVKRMLEGKIALSTRIAGTVVMISFVIIAQSHFFGGGDISQRLAHLYNGQDLEPNMSSLKASPLEDIHQARTPTSWLRLQDHDAAREIIRLIKPSAYSYIARVYEPLVFVKKGSNRVPMMKEPALLPAIYDFAHHQLGTFVFIDIVVIALLRLLISYLLPEDETKAEELHDSSDQSNLSVKTLSGGHTLDIAMLAYSPIGYVISVGLDRMIRLWDLNHRNKGISISNLEKEIVVKFPVLAVAMHEDSDWLAILSSDMVIFWNIITHVHGSSVAVETYNQKPESFFLEPAASSDIPRAVIVWKNGTAVDVDPASRETRESTICLGLTCARPLLSKVGKDPRVSLVATSRNGDVHIMERNGLLWERRNLLSGKLASDEIHQVVALSPLPYFLASSKSEIHLISLDDGTTSWSFSVEEMRSRSLACAFTCHRSSNTLPLGLISFTFSYLALDSGDCVLHTFTPQDDDDAICLQNIDDVGTSSGWCSWADARERKKHIGNPGVWSLLSDGSTLGLRRRPRTGPRSRPGHQRQAIPGVRSRIPNTRSQEFGTFSCWELWRAASSDWEEVDETTPLLSEEDAGHLVVCELGPSVRVGPTSVAFAYGNVIKLATLSGHKPFDVGIDEVGRESPMNVPTRRRKMGTTARPGALG